jgi:hypothetical protein
MVYSDWLLAVSYQLFAFGYSPLACCLLITYYCLLLTIPMLLSFAFCDHDFFPKGFFNRALAQK